MLWDGARLLDSRLRSAGTAEGVPPDPSPGPPPLKKCDQKGGICVASSMLLGKCGNDDLCRPCENDCDECKTCGDVCTEGGKTGLCHDGPGPPGSCGACDPLTNNERTSSDELLPMCLYISLYSSELRKEEITISAPQKREKPLRKLAKGLSFPFAIDVVGFPASFFTVSLTV